MSPNVTDTRVHLLVADQDPAIALAAKMALDDFGYQVRALDSGEATLALVEKRPPDLILLDVVLPGISGFEVCRRIRESSQHQIPIIVATRLDDSESIETAYQAGATAFVTKPINWPLLRHQLQYVLRSSRDQARLIESEERYALAASGANDGLWDWHIAERRVYFSPRWREQLGLSEVDIGSQMESWLDRIHPDDVLGFRNELNAHLAGRAAKFETEYRIRDGHDRYRWMLCRALAIRDADGNAYRIAGSQTDVTARKQAEEQLLHDALHDALTGLANRKLLLERITHSTKLAQRRPDHRFAVAVLDLDRFKNINDSLGHLAGDRLLGLIAERVSGLLRSSDTLARIGGDEFAILFDNCGEVSDLRRVMERIRREVAMPYTLLNQEVVVTVSAGIAMGSTSFGQAQNLLRDAEIAMYHAKSQGKDRHTTFDAGMHAEVADMLQLEGALRAAIAHAEFRLHFQPIRRLEGDAIVGFEALLRWEHPVRGTLAPAAFLGLAEETGLIIPIGHWILREATRQLAAWHRTIPRLRSSYVSVNLSSAEFANPELLAQVERALSESGLSPRHLRLEITETVLIQNAGHASQVLEQLRARGITTAIDDFGTGYSSLSYLHSFSFDALKIDRAFTQEIDRLDKSQAIVRAIVTLANNLGLDVIAEGGENPAEVSCLRDAGCEFNQGNAFQQAVPADQIEAVVNSQLRARVPPVSRLQTV